MQNLSEKRLVLVSHAVAILLNIILWIILFIKFGVSTRPLPLHFNIVYGIDFVGKAYHVYEIPAAGLLILIINLIFEKIFFRVETIFGYFFLFAAAGIQLFLLIAALALIVFNA